MKPVLDGTVALVTGASSGIGAATAAALAAQGAAVALAARRGHRLEELAAGITGQGGTALVLECDITDEQQAAAAVQRTVAELGRLDTLINNAGVMLLGPAAGAPLPEWQQMVQLNVLGLLYCAHAALPHLLRAATDGPRQVADMVNISSVAGRVAHNGNGAYSLTKHGHRHACDQLHTGPGEMRQARDKRSTRDQASADEGSGRDLWRECPFDRRA
jgi:NADP-dependent 3-hydroxy acid dehydrogenase YdfG